MNKERIRHKLKQVKRNGDSKDFVEDLISVIEEEVDEKVKETKRFFDKYTIFSLIGAFVVGFVVAKIW